MKEKVAVNEQRVSLALATRTRNLYAEETIRFLGLKKGSRLYRALVRDRQVAAETQTFTYDLTRGSDLFVVDVTGLPTVTGDQLEQEVAREIDLLYANDYPHADVLSMLTLDAVHRAVEDEER